MKLPESRQHRLQAQFGDVIRQQTAPEDTLRAILLLGSVLGSFHAFGWRRSFSQQEAGGVSLKLAQSVVQVPGCKAQVGERVV
jgi:hypothetical protein